MEGGRVEGGMEEEEGLEERGMEVEEGLRSTLSFCGWLTALKVLAVSLGKVGWRIGVAEVED